MARETRRQRRDARRAEGEQGGSIARPPRLRTAEAASAPDVGSQLEVTSAPVLAQRVGGRRWFAFIRESWAELRKVEWPSRAQVIQGTIVVMIACAIVGIFLYGADQAIRPLVKRVFLGQ